MSSLSQFLEKNEVSIITVPPPSNLIDVSLSLAKESSRPFFIITWESSPENGRILSYMNLGSLQEVEDHLLIFDSLPHVQEVCEFEDGAIEGWNVIEHLRSQGNRIFILVTFAELDEERLELLPENVDFLYLYSADQGGSLNFEVESTVMTSTQVKAYKQERSKEKSGYKLSTYSLSQQFCNIVYPNKIQLLLNKGSEFMKRSINLEAVFAIYGFTDLLQNSPKFTHLLRFLLQHQEEKHIIITRYRRFAGLEILSLLIRGLGLPLVELNLRTPDKFLLCEQFSQVKSGIMVCTMVPPMGIKNVRHLHFLDGSLGNFDNFLSILFKYHLYDGEPKLTVHNHIATAPGIETPDLLSYFKFGQKMEKKMCLWQNQIFRGKKILQKEDRLEVVD